jgi:hypothetical protein
MGPLFSLLLAGIGAGALVVCVFIISLFKYSTRLALVLAVSFVGGAALGFVLAVFAATLVTGVGATLVSGLAIFLYLAWLASAGVAGGVVAARYGLGLAKHHWGKTPAAAPPVK